MFRKMFALLFFAVAFAAAVNAQCGDRSELGRVLAGPCIERAVRQAYAPYAPVDFYLNNGYGYGYYPYGYGNGRSAVAGAVAGAATGALTGWLTARAATNRDEYVRAPDGGRTYYASAPQGREVRWSEPKPAKPLDCRKPSGKRGKNEAACAAAEEEAAARQRAAEQEAGQRALAASPWELKNQSGFVVEVFDGNRKLGRMEPNESWPVLEPVNRFRATLLQPGFSGSLTKAQARIRPANNFRGWVITTPRTKEE